MSDAKPDVKAIFCEALSKTSPEGLSAYLEQACCGDDQVRQRVEALLQANRAAGQFLGGPPSETVTSDASPIAEGPGSQIGPYKLLERLGEGTFGVVYMAEQREPVRRKVALKMLKPGMDTKHVIARFEAEEQALALMDHPNIARVFDAGATESGRPYFVMELVKGRPITDYCDAKGLTTEQRLGLFISVCHAVQHAHQKGIIHRDIKPSNVLVEQHDDKPVVKVIDFGVAKALHQPLTEKTLFTGFGQMVGTVLYMSPEQAELNALDVDTRSDVYSLGVLLYELLTGVTPFDRKRLLSAAFDDMRRIIREEEPPKPSTRITTLGDSATELCKHRQTEPKRLSAMIRGDLDWIVMNSIEKDRTRRYDTASGLAADVQRFLNDEPILARPPSLAYRIHKFAGRNRAAVVASALVLGSLLLGIVATSWMAKRAWEEKLAAREAQEAAQAAREEAEFQAARANRTLRALSESSYGKAVAAALGGDLEEAERALELASSSYSVHVLRGLIALNKGELDEAIQCAEAALGDEAPAEDLNRIGACALLAYASINAGYDDRYYPLMHRLRNLTPRTECDRLLLAHGQLQLNPREALGLIETVPRLKCSPAGLLIRAAAAAGTPESRDKCLRDYEYAQFLFRDGQFVVSLRLWTLGSAIRQSRDQGHKEDVVRLIQEGRPIAHKFEAVAANPFGDWALSYFYEACGQEENAFRALCRVGRHPGSYSLYLAAECLRRHDYVAALQEFDAAVDSRHAQSKYVRIAKAGLVRGLPDGRERVRSMVRDLAVDESPWIRTAALHSLCQACDAHEIQTEASRAIAVTTDEAREMSDPFDGIAQAEFLAGRLTEAQLLERSSASSTAISHYSIAAMALANRDRAKWREHLRKCVATGSPDNMACAYARAYLARMDADPAWPQWLQEKTTEPSRTGGLP